MNLITVKEVLQLHSQSIERYGGSGTISKDTGGCIDGRIGNAALAEQFVTDDERVRPGLCFAGFLLFYLIRDHCFTDGNKRIGWMAAMRVLADLGLTLETSNEEAFAFCDAVSTGSIKDGRQVVQWFAQRLAAPDV